MKFTIAPFFVLTVLLISCESHVQKADDAFEQAKEERLKSKETNEIMPEEKTKEISVIKKNETVKIIEKPDEWTLFRTDIEKKLKENATKIEEVKANKELESKALKKAKQLEDDNKSIYKQMNDYNEEVKVKWENFKAKINHTVKEIDIEISDISTKK